MCTQMIFPFTSVPVSSKLATVAPMSMDYMVSSVLPTFRQRFNTIEVIVLVDRLTPRRLPNRTWVRTALIAQ